MAIPGNEDYELAAVSYPFARPEVKLFIERLARGETGPAARCEYAVRYVTVKARWSLTVDPGERAALANVLTGDCGARPISVTLAP